MGTRKQVVDGSHKLVHIECIFPQEEADKIEVLREKLGAKMGFKPMKHQLNEMIFAEGFRSMKEKYQIK